MGPVPSVNQLFETAAKVHRQKLIAVLLTGMGDDGAQGMKEVYERGGMTIAQNEESCVVFGMPKVAIEYGVVKRILPLETISQSLLGLVSKIGAR